LPVADLIIKAPGWKDPGVWEPVPAFVQDVSWGGNFIMEKGWWVVRISCDPAWTDELAGAVAGMFQGGVEIRDNGLVFYLSHETHGAGWRETLERFLAHWAETLGLPVRPDVQVDFCPDQDWNARWKEGFKPLRVGRRFVVAPTWETYHPDPGDRVLWIDPGRAFGTGHHETTRLCLRWLEDVCDRGDAQGPLSLLDVGTGSGILAMGAALLGCRPVVGVDNDPEAVQVARENLAANPAAAHVVLMHGSVEDVQGDFHLVVANIQADPLMAMAPRLVAKVKKRGRLALSGILGEQAQRVTEAYEALGLACRDRRDDGEWCLLELSWRG